MILTKLRVFIIAFVVVVIYDCSVIEKSAEYGIHCLPCSEANNVIYLYSYQLRVHIDV